MSINCFSFTYSGSKIGTTMDDSRASAGGTILYPLNDIEAIQQLIEHLDTARGVCLLSLIMPPTESKLHVYQRLDQDLSLASNIQPRSHRLSKMFPIIATMQLLRSLPALPPNGGIFYCGDVVATNGQERKIALKFEPPEKVEEFEYQLDIKFHTEALKAMLA
jgi:peptide subunit release factor 1 (eRF1)